MDSIVFIDSEVSFDGKVQDIGGVKDSGQEFHSKSMSEFVNFLRGNKYVCGHNLLLHDLKYLQSAVNEAGVTKYIDSLYLSPLLFPKKPYHKLVKDDKFHPDEFNNPLNDSKKCKDLFYDEVTEFKGLDDRLQQIFYELLHEQKEFSAFFEIVGYKKTVHNLEKLIRAFFYSRICENAPICDFAKERPIELAYALALINIFKSDSITPSWVLRSYPRVENILHLLRGKKCLEQCDYCGQSLDEKKALKRFFKYDKFRNYEGMPLQHNAVLAAINNKSILAIFPTGGGKSITFQLPALMAGENEKGLTVVISPLQSLMKDQVDNLERQHDIIEAVTINGSLDPIDRSEAFRRVEDGSASMLYISPELLRSKSIEGLLLKRNVVRFVVDEAHCFSSWGHDFRVDYLYIGDFIKQLQEKKGLEQNISVSCFTATAKQKVINDIKEYFKDKLSLELEIFRASAARTNLKYHVFSEEGDDEKYDKLRRLICENECPTIIYVSRVKRTTWLANRLTDDGYPAVAYHGQMDKQEKVQNQETFMNGEVQIIVATTAFGMGVDKKDVGMVIHYDISDSLENYVQEAGRAGRDESINADCYVLFNDEDLNKHFTLLNQNKLSLKEIQQIWKAVRETTKIRSKVSHSALEIARKAGWDDSVNDIETRVKTAINALEQSGFLKRGQNMPRIYANSILVKNMEEARKRIDESPRFDDSSRQKAIRIIGNLISAKNRTKGQEDEAESRVDYISDRLGIVREDVIRTINLLREENILADAKDLTAYIKRKENKNRSLDILSTHKKTEDFLLDRLDEGEQTWNIKELNESAQDEHEDITINHIRTIINYWTIKKIIKRTRGDEEEYKDKNHVIIKPFSDIEILHSKKYKRDILAEFIINYLYSKASQASYKQGGEEIVIEFSVLELKDQFEHNLLNDKTDSVEIEDALYYLTKINALRIEGAFLVIYNAMQIERIEKDNKAYYKKEDYTQLERFYQNKKEQIHIVGEYANKMMSDYQEAVQFVDDYFTLSYDLFLNKYFRGRREEIEKNITPKKFKKLFGELSPAQLSIIKDHKSEYIVVAAGPGSGKTRLLAHKLASLYMMEDVKHEQMLMLTFSRAAVTEFKKRLMGLIGNAANFVPIMTFHSYCFDLLGKVGTLEKADKIIEETVAKINNGEVDEVRLTKTVLVIDEAQDMSEAEFALVKALIDKNEEMHVIAVGDDDQNIYQFRGSSSEHLESLIKDFKAKKYELVENYRSKANIVDFANQFAEKISHRLKTISIQPKEKNNGIVKVHKYLTDNLAIPVVNSIIKDAPKGTTCVLTRTNAEALNITGLLLKNNINAKLIQTNSGFNLFNLIEIRSFLNEISKYNDGYTINEEVWKNAKSFLIKKYCESANLKGCLKLIKDFEETNTKTRYKSDFEQFVRESKMEDFFSLSEDVIFVSTIHQAKGREFKNVYLSLSTPRSLDDETFRTIYVALTRAEDSLSIHYNGDYFDNIQGADIQHFVFKDDFSMPPQIILQLTHKDVNLGYFENCQEEIDKLRSGDELTVDYNGCYFKNKLLLKFSNRFSEQLDKLEYRKYAPSFAAVKNVVYWWNKDAEKEIMIFLPDIHFEKTEEDDSLEDLLF